MKRIKQRLDIEFPQKKKAVQNLIDNARQFEKESLGPEEDNANLLAQRNMDWNFERKIKLVRIDDEERGKDRGFVKRVRERWDLDSLDVQLLVHITLETMHLVFKKNRR